MFKIGDYVKVHSRYCIITGIRDEMDVIVVQHVHYYNEPLSNSFLANIWYGRHMIKPLEHFDKLVLSGNQDIDQADYLEDIFI